MSTNYDDAFLELERIAITHGFTFQECCEAIDLRRDDERDGDDYWARRGPLALLNAVRAMHAPAPTFQDALDVRTRKF